MTNATGSICLHTCLGAFAVLNGTCECLTNFARMHDAHRSTCVTAVYSPTPPPIPISTYAAPFVATPNAWSNTDVERSTLEAAKMDMYLLTRSDTSRPLFAYIDAAGNVRGSAKGTPAAADETKRIFIPINIDYSITVERRGVNGSSFNISNFFG